VRPRKRRWGGRRENYFLLRYLLFVFQRGSRGGGGRVLRDRECRDNQHRAIDPMTELADIALSEKRLAAPDGRTERSPVCEPCERKAAPRIDAVDSLRDPPQVAVPAFDCAMMMMRDRATLLHGLSKRSEPNTAGRCRRGRGESVGYCRTDEVRPRAEAVGCRVRFRRATRSTAARRQKRFIWPSMRSRNESAPQIGKSHRRHKWQW